MTNNLKEEIDKIIDSFREDCWTVRQSMDYEDQKERAIGVQALASLNTKNAILTLINQKEKEARIDELEKISGFSNATGVATVASGELGNLRDRIKQLKEELNKEVK